MSHISVLKKDVQKYLSLQGGEVVIDATLGLGGHALDIVEAIGEKGKLIAFEQDERNLLKAKERLKKYASKVTYIHDNFRHLKNRVKGEKVDRIFFDLGLSSPHVDEAERGFSFMKDGPLDMRFDQRNQLTANDVVNSYSQEDLVKIFYDYGEERMAKKIAREICARRKEKPFTTTTELAEFVDGIVPKKFSKKASKSHPATKIFQAIRIEVNNEMEVLKEALEGAMEILKVGGLIVIISYHSLEDRVVKRFFQSLEKPPVSPEKSIYQSYGDPIVKRITQKPIVPSEEEIGENPRSRSAKMRVYIKLK